MHNPTVCAICLVNGRPEMVQRAIRCFREQTYPSAYLQIYDTTLDPLYIAGMGGQRIMRATDAGNLGTIGTLRNSANTCSNGEVIVHWDSDDWSHPRRIEEQVALLQASGKQCVGYRDMLFWRSLECPQIDESLYNDRPCEICDDDGLIYEAWLYSNNDPRYCLGTSLCYWRSAWESRPFPDAPKPGGSGEDKLWLDGIDSLGISSMYLATSIHTTDKSQMVASMIASIHGGNTSTQYADLGRVESNNWRRAPEWDAHCRERMKL